MNFSELAQRKVAGIPVLYLAGAFVAILAIVAWKMKPSVPDDEVTGDEGTTPDNVPTDSGDPDAADYSGLVSQGTVTVVQGTQTPTDAVKQTNEDWERAAITYLVDAKLASPSAAQNAIHKYLEGVNLSYDEGKLKDAAITKLKLPPEPLVQVGTVGTAPAQKQFSNFPGRHTVKGPNDNTASKLAQLYYGNSAADRINTIAAANTKLGPASTSYSPGAVVSIPTWTTPYTMTATKYYNTASKIGSKNGLSAAQVVALNPGMVFPVKVGTKVRIK
jgi:hypothetical protein